MALPARIARAPRTLTRRPDPNIADAYALVLIGTGPSQLVHDVVPDYPLRLDLFDHDGTIVAIELADARNGGSQFTDWWTAAGPPSFGRPQ